MKKRIILMGIILTLVICKIFSIISYADDSQIYVNLANTYLDKNGNSLGVGYSIGEAGGELNPAAKIYYLRTYTSAGANAAISTAQRNLYCIKADYGDTWNTSKSNIVSYNLKYDLQKDRETVLSKLLEIDSDANGVVEELLDPTKDAYRQILWILDNSFITGESETEKREFLAKAGIVWNEKYEVYEYKPVEGYDYTDTIVEYEEYETPLTDTEINAIQKAAIWYYTNYVLDQETLFNNKSSDTWLHLTTDDGNSYATLFETSKYRNEQACILYNYLVDAAENNKGLYTAANNYTIPTNSLTVNDIALENTPSKTYELGAERRSEGYLIAGPIEIKKSNDGEYDIDFKVTNTSGTEIAYEITDSTGTELEYTTIKDFVGGTEFYIKVSTSVATEFNVKVDVKTVTTQKDLWLVGTETTITNGSGEEVPAIDLEAEQPIVEVTRVTDTKTIQFLAKEELIDIPVTKVWEDNSDERGERPTSIELILKANGVQIATHTLTGTGDTWTYTFTDLPVKQDGQVIQYTVEEVDVSDEYTTSMIGSAEEGYIITNTINEEKIFDLALRKYIVKLNNTELSQLQIPQRVPNISETTLTTGTTATYNHKKDPVFVEMGDIVTYNITIYNEGEKAGYASQIIDQLPTGLIYNPSSSIISKDPAGNEKNTYTASYDPTLNKITFDIDTSTAKSINAYETGKLDYETLEIKCKVIHEPKTDSTNILTNVAWISGAYDTVDNEVATDRDSQTSSTKSPKVSKDTMESYKGNSSNKFTLSDSEYFYKGQEDDDDFEKLYVQTFDLALRKFITSVDGEEINTRYPMADVTELVNGTSTTAKYNHTKVPVASKIGDKIVYTLRVYNEGEVDGYASEIKDYLPPHLQFVAVTESAINAQYGWTISEDGRIATTTYLADKEISKFNGTSLDCEDIKIECKIINTAVANENITNIAEISKYKYGNTVVEKDIDSTSNNITNNLPSDADLPNYKKDQENDAYVPGNEDDDDFEKVYVKEFDLALRKFITEIDGEKITGREPEVDVTPLVNGTSTTAIYNHPKTPLGLEMGSKVVYTLRIYNEGEIDGYASAVKDYLPPHLEFIKDSEINNQYGWSVAEGGRIVITTYLANKEISKFDGTTLDYEDIKIECKVKNTAKTGERITNIADISEYKYGDNTIPSDIDSTSNNMGEDLPSDEDLPNYKKDQENDAYVPGNEDDDDFEKVYVKEFDLALRKFITKIEDEEITTRIPMADVTGLVNGTSSTAKYNHSKKPLELEIGNTVVYTLRIYNEGEIDGYASEVKDYLPPHLEFIKDSEINTQYGWTISEDGRIATTKYLANKEISKFNGTALDYEDIKIECKVKNTAKTGERITNIAEISEYKYGDYVFPSDIDSTSNNITKNLPKDEELPNYKKDQENDAYVPGNEDDDDFEKVYVKEFDLALRKFITEIDGDKITGREPKVDVTPLTNGTSTTATYNHPKTPLGLEIGSTVVYTLRIYNEGEIDGYASEVKDYLPPHLEFVKDSTINTQYGWTISEDGRIATTKYLANKEISKFNGKLLDYEDIKIECKVKNTAKTRERITNIAEISEYKYGDYVFPSDIDSTSNNITKNLPKDEELPNYKKAQENDAYVPGNEDDDDFEKVYVKEFDLALRKFITQIGEETITGREPQVDVTPLTNGTSTTAKYKHPKTPIVVEVGDTVVYTLRVYNEGEIDGYASEVKDYLPSHLEFVKDSEINTQYGWTISEDGRIATTKYLANKEISKFNGTTLDYEDIKIECKVLGTAIPHENITNIAEISEYKYGDNTFPSDIDSESDNMDIPEDDKLPDYKKEQEKNEYVPGNEDDDDFEKIYVKEFDLALRKFITQVEDEVIKTRVPKVKINDGQITYEHTKDPVLLHVGDTVIYTIRVYNEGEVDGYASEIADDIPEYLEYLPQNSTNIEYMWKMYDKDGKETEKVEDAVRVKTQYLSKERSEDNLLVAFNGTEVAYKDVKIAFKVKDPNSNQYIITNHAQITDDTDKDGDEIKDKDSEPDKWNDDEDDQDIENVKVQYFDLSLLKYVTKVIVIENGVEKITETGYNGTEDPEPVVKVELHRKKLSDVVVKFGYGIKVTNEGDIAGYAKEITDYIPKGLKFVAEDNPTWKDEGNGVISTKQLEDTLLQPGESATVEVILTWINGEDNLMEKTNTAEISIDDNEYDVPDKDSTPDNKEEDEDDIDIAKVILTITTGAAKTYFKLAIGLLLTLAIGIILIKRFVL